MAKAGKGGKRAARRTASPRRALSVCAALLGWLASGIAALLKRLGWRRGLACGLLLAAFGGGFYLAELYADIAELIQARSAALSSAIYSAPLAITPGDGIVQLHLLERLDALSYARVSPVVHPGEYSMQPGGMIIYVREFTIGTRGFPAALVRIGFDGDRITRIADASGAVVRGVELEPEVIGRLLPDAPAERVQVDLTELPPFLVKGVLATEDRYFYYHPGFDPIRIIEAAIVDFHSHRLSQGASTITQQLARTFIENRARTFHRKARELAIALVLEMRLSKNEILDRYINDVPMGEYYGAPIDGLPLAARYFFNKDLSQVTPAEAAMLIGMIQAPTLYDPRRHPDYCRTRRDMVLGLMRHAKLISDGEYDQAVAAPITLVKMPGLRRAPYFTDYVISRINRRAALRGHPAGLKVYTTLDPELEQAARASVEGNLERLEHDHPALRRRVPNQRLESSLVALDTRTGGIVAMIGGRDYATSQFNRAADAARQPGSAFKPIVYVTALDPVWNPLPQPVTLATLLPDRPMSFGGWTPANYERTYQGQATVAEALAESLNVPTAYLGSLLGTARIIQTAHLMGIHGNLPNYLPITIGAGDVTLLDLTGAYQVFADAGVEQTPYAIAAIVAGDGRVLYQHAPQPVRLMSSAVAYLVTGALEGVLKYGTGAGAARLGLAFPAAGKTGTTDDYRDAYFMGYTRDLVCGVWVGFDQPESIGLTGAAAALAAWVNFMNSAERRPAETLAPPPPGITMVTIDPTSGGLATSGCPRVATLPFLEGTEPTQPCPLHSGAIGAISAAVSAFGFGANGARSAAPAGSAGAATPAPSSTPGTAANGVLGAVGNFFGSLFGH